jgi:hypothetical protein
VADGTIRMPEAVFFTPAQSPGRDEGSDGSDDLELIDLDFYPEAAHVDANVAAVWNERRYRLLMTHEFHESCKSFSRLPSFSPLMHVQWWCRCGTLRLCLLVLLGTSASLGVNSSRCSMPFRPKAQNTLWRKASLLFTATERSKKVPRHTISGH